MKSATRSLFSKAEYAQVSNEFTESFPLYDKMAHYEIKKGGCHREVVVKK